VGRPVGTVVGIEDGTVEGTTYGIELGEENGLVGFIDGNTVVAREEKHVGTREGEGVGGLVVEREGIVEGADGMNVWNEDRLYVKEGEVVGIAVNTGLISMGETTVLSIVVVTVELEMTDLILVATVSLIFINSAEVLSYGSLSKRV
jgi:hypothetical protein